jgi:hypothetical protein
MSMTRSRSPVHPYRSWWMVATPSLPDGAAAQARAASCSGGIAGHLAAKGAGVISPSARWIRRRM